MSSIGGELNNLRERLEVLRFLTPRASAALATEEARVQADREAVVVPGQKTLGIFVLSEALLSRRRLRGLFLIVLLMVLLLALAAAMYFNAGFRQRSYAKKTVLRMQNALSYSAVGLDTSTQGNSRAEVNEQFQYVAPDQVYTRYISKNSSASALDCPDREIVVLGRTRYQRCNDPNFSVQGWWTDTLDNRVFDSTLFQPWVRFAWCNTFDEADEAQLINGVDNLVYSCTVPNEQEARTIWSTVSEEDANAQERAKFLTDATVDITVWVRQTDGFIGRFAMTKTYPQGGATVTETVDYVYDEFGAIEPIEAPQVTSSSAGSGGAGGSGVGQTPVFSGSGGRPSAIDFLRGNITGQPGTVPGQTSGSAGQVSGADFSTATINGQRISLEVADDDQERQRGLKMKFAIPRDSGMLFVFPSEQQWVFWMQDVYIPLDVMFIDGTYRIVDIQTMKTEPGVPSDQLTRYQSRLPAKYALEVNAGVASEHGFEPGMFVQLD